MKDLFNQWQALDLIKVFEIPVIDTRTESQEYLLFDLAFSLEKGQLIAEHEATTQAEADSDKIAFVAVEVDPDFSLDENLQKVLEACQMKIIDSEFFTLND